MGYLSLVLTGPFSSVLLSLPLLRTTQKCDATRAAVDDATDPSDERFHVRGGNELIVHGLAERLPGGSLHLDAPLTALWRRADGS